MSNLLPISAVVLARNEEANIGRCLASLQWVDEVLVIDSGSTDNTPAIAKSFPNVLYILTDWKGYAANKQQGVDGAKNDVIFWVDADEEVTPELRKEIESSWDTINAGWEATPVYSLPRKTFFMGEWIRYCGWYPDRQKRLFNRRYARFNTAGVHEDVEITNTGKPAVLQRDLLHYSFQSIEKYFAKMNTYGKLGAEEMLKKGKKGTFTKLVFNPWWAFVQSYFIKSGFLQGRTGFIISCGNAFGKFVKYVHLYYANRKKQ